MFKVHDSSLGFSTKPLCHAKTRVIACLCCVSGRTCQNRWIILKSCSVHKGQSNYEANNKQFRGRLDPASMVTAVHLYTAQILNQSTNLEAAHSHELMDLKLLTVYPLARAGIPRLALSVSYTHMKPNPTSILSSSVMSSFTTERLSPCSSLSFCRSVADSGDRTPAITLRVRRSNDLWTTGQSLLMMVRLADRGSVFVRKHLKDSISLPVCNHPKVALAMVV